MNKKIFRAIFLSTLLSLFLAMGTVLFITNEEITASERSRLTQLTDVLSAGYLHDGTAFLQEVPADSCRITLIGADGTVIFDNELQDLPNHAGRAEIQQAVRQGTGESYRFSDSLQRQVLYHAKALPDGTVLRTGVATDTLLSVTYRMAGYFALILMVLCLLSLYLASHISRSILQPLYHTDLNHPVNQDTYEEIKPFLQEIARKQQQIDTQIDILKNRNKEFLTITRSMAEGLILLNSRGDILTINKTARQIFDLDEDCTGKNFQELLQHSTPALKELFSPQSKVSKRSYEFENKGRDYHLRFNQIRVDGKVVGYALLVIDVTETKRAEAQRQEFTANVSHELKTPLQSIIGSAELIESGIVRPEDLKTFAGRIREQGMRLISLIEDIIFLSSLDEGSGNAVFEQVSVHRLCTEVFDVLKDKAESAGVTLSTRGPDLQFPAVSRYIYELLYNLCDNAIRYNRPGGTVCVCTEDNDKKYVITVRDTGIGIAPEHQARIFERFYRVDKSHSRETGGTGLGLSICKRTVLFHHGKIKVSSTLGRGSSFRITLYKSELKKLASSGNRQRREAEDGAAAEAALQAPAAGAGKMQACWHLSLTGRKTSADSQEKQPLLLP